VSAQPHFGVHEF